MKLFKGTIFGSTKIGAILGSTKILVAGAAVIGTTTVGSVVGVKVYQSDFEQTKTGMVIEAGQQLDVSVEDFFDTPAGNYKRIEMDTSKVDTLTVGEYEITATYMDEQYSIKVSVQDTKKPEVMLRDRHVYMSDLSKPIDVYFEYYDATKVTMSLAGTEKIQELEGLTEEKVKILTDIIELPCDQEKLAKINSVTDEEGVLRGVLKFEDAYGNYTLEEIVIIYDKAIVEEPEEVTEEPEESDEKDEKPEKSDDKKTSNDKKPSSNTQTSTKPSGNQTGSTGSSSGNTTTPSQPETPSTTPSEPTPETPSTTPSEPEIDEPDDYMTPAMHAAVAAGYYNVIPTASGGYVVMVPIGESSKGDELINAYLDSLGLESEGGYGCLINASKNQYMCGVEANRVREKAQEKDPTDPDFWN